MSDKSLLEECNDVADIIIKVAFESGFEDSDSPNPCCVDEGNGSKVETLPEDETACINGGPSKSFVKGLIFELSETAQYHLDHHFPGYTINESVVRTESDDGEIHFNVGHVIRTPDDKIHVMIGQDGSMVFDPPEINETASAFDRGRDVL